MLPTFLWRCFTNGFARRFCAALNATARPTRDFRSRTAFDTCSLWPRTGCRFSTRSGLVSRLSCRIYPRASRALSCGFCKCAGRWRVGPDAFCPCGLDFVGCPRCTCAAACRAGIGPGLCRLTQTRFAPGIAHACDGRVAAICAVCIGCALRFPNAARACVRVSRSGCARLP